MSNLAKAAEAQPFFSTEQLQMIRTSFLNGASEQEAGVLLELARLRRLNPITRQIHFVRRWDGQKRCEVWAAQVGIDGFRAIAERTGLYDGQDEAEFEYDAKGGLKLARVRVYRKDWSRPAVGVAHYSEYVQLTKDGKPTHMWGSKVHVMLGKCAEAIALRKAFPEDTSGLYAPEELPETETPRTVAPLPPAPAQESAKPKPKVLAAEVVRMTDAKAALASQLGWQEPETVEAEPVVVPDMSPAEQVLALIAEAQTVADLAPVVKRISEAGLAKDAGIRAAYAARNAELKKGVR